MEIQHECEHINLDPLRECFGILSFESLDSSENKTLAWNNDRSNKLPKQVMFLRHQFECQLSVTSVEQQIIRSFLFVGPGLQQEEWHLVFSFNGHTSLEEARKCFNFNFIGMLDGTLKEISNSIVDYDDCTGNIHMIMNFIQYKYMDLVTGNLRIFL